MWAPFLVYEYQYPVYAGHLPWHQWMVRYTYRQHGLCPVRTRDYDIIFDAGNGIAKADRYISQEKPVCLFLSHFHIDHIAGLHTLVKFRLKQGLKIFCIPGELLSSIHLSGNHSPCRWRNSRTPPMQSSSRRASTSSLSRLNASLVHPAPCYGYRVEIDGKVITFWTDTGALRQCNHSCPGC